MVWLTNSGNFIQVPEQQPGLIELLVRPQELYNQSILSLWELPQTTVPKVVETFIGTRITI